MSKWFAADPSFERCLAALVRSRAAFELFTRPATDLILQRVDTTAPRCILDLGCGIGDPALALAARAPESRITACDRVVPFVAAMREEAQRVGMTNVRGVIADMSALPLAAASQDFVVARLSIQLAADPTQVLAEVARVLRPGGRTLLVVWAAPEQPLMRITVNGVLAACGAPVFEAGSAGPFRFCHEGVLATLLERAGFTDVQEATEQRGWTWPGDAESFWRATRQTSAPLFDPLLARLDVAARQAIDDGVLTALRAYERGRTFEVPVEVRWVQASRT